MFERPEEIVINSFVEDLNYTRILNAIGPINTQAAQDCAEYAITTHREDWTIEEEQLEEKIRNYLLEDGPRDEDFLSDRTWEVLNKIAFDIDMAHKFRVDPKRQNTAEKCLSVYLQLIAARNDDILFTVAKPEPISTYIYEGIIVTKKPKKGTVKSIDFQIQLVNGNTYYLFHKYTDGSGGNQDMSESDVIRCINAAAPCADTDKRFIFVCDGSHFDGCTLSKLKSQYTKENTLVCSTNDLEETLLTDAANWF